MRCSTSCSANSAGNLAGLDAARRTEALVKTQLLPQSELSLQSALAAYENGKAEFAMLLEAQRQIRTARQELLKSQVEAQCAWPTSNASWEKTCEDLHHPARHRRCSAPWAPAATGSAPVRRRMRPTATRPRGGRLGTQGAQAALLPQPDGAGRHLADAEEGPDGHGLRRGLRGRGRGQLAGRGGGVAAQLRISTEKIQKLGVRTEAASLRLLGRTVRAAGRVEPDERRVAVVAPKFEGYVERLHVNATGQPVSRGPAAVRGLQPRTGGGAARVRSSRCRACGR